MKHICWLFFFFICIAPARAADEIHSILSISAELDDQEAQFFLLGFDQRVGEDTWVSLSFNHVELDDEPADSSSKFAAIGLSHEIGQWQLSVGVDHWEVEGNNLESTDILGGIYYRFERWTLGVDLAHRDTKLRFIVPGSDRRLSDDVTGDGYGLGVSYSPNDDWYLYANYMTYDYTGRIIRRPEYEAFSRASFTADDSLLDHNWLVGADYYWGRYSLGVYTTRYRSAFDSLDTATYNLSGRMLLSEHADIQLKTGVIRADEFEDSVYGGIGFTFYW